MTTETKTANQTEVKEAGTDTTENEEKDVGSTENKTDSEETTPKEDEKAISDAAKEEVKEAGSDDLLGEADSKEDCKIDTKSEAEKEETNSSEVEKILLNMKNLPSKKEFDEVTARSKKLEEILNIQIKTLCERTDVSAFNKVNMVLEIIKTSQPKEEKKEIEGSKETNKRSADDTSEEPKSKSLKTEEGKDKDAKEGEREKNKDDIEDSDEEGNIDSCVVCGLYLSVFKEDSAKELHHYLSHGFNILKEFDILKPDDSLFLVCNLCGSPFPKKCHVNFRKHLVSGHEQKIIEIFREI